ncbi:hypothetical protein BLA6860_04426 [Burkholderia lata]|uniref:hypothetical protein n=1 Tax=Burkholderia lata (strain ATCC 17760 / DSM 23089 / LMG 22485 / NCIMB 9086 / R18194 / 383) TaxID=482957 RepID=UPI0014532B86|nr:hypothetical protein [Burkholderia lata]VWB92956.1 hypothetical protein BLA6860_04426 [Burkholderia lata]
MIWTISYSVIPSFESSYSYYLCRTQKVGAEAELFFQQGGLGLDFDVPPPFWKQWEANSARETPKPFHVPVEAADAIYKRLQEIQLPPLPPFAAGCDGVTYELDLTAGFNMTRLRWWGDLPEQWETLRDVVRMIEVLHPKS